MPLLSKEQMMSHHGTTFLAAYCVVHKDGSVSNCKMVCSHHLFDETVIETVQARRYTPVTFRGRPIDAPYVFQFRMVGPR